MNQSRIQNLRFLSLKLEVSGTAAVANNTKLLPRWFWVCATASVCACYATG